MQDTELERQIRLFCGSEPDLTSRDARTLVAAVFDSSFYRDRYADLRDVDDPLKHYLELGWREGRDPSRVFDTRAYLAHNPYLRSAEICPLLHYAVRGAAEGQSPSPRRHSRWHSEVAALFDAAFYRETYPDITADIEPLKHYLELGWREGRNPSRGFDTRFYVEANPEVEARGICPLVHFATQGREQGRLPTRPPDPIETALAECRPRAERIRAWSRPPPRDRFDRDALRAGIRSALAELPQGLVFALSHDDYSEVTGGVQNCLVDEERVFARRKFAYAHVCPAQPLPDLAESPDGEFLVSLRINGKRLCCATITEVAAALAAIRDLTKPCFAVIHHLLGFAPEAVAAAIRLLSPGETVVVLHDLFTLCPNYMMLRNNVAFCHGPAPTSKACGICIYGPERPRHIERIGALFGAIEPSVLAASDTIAQFWRERAPYRYKTIAVVPLAQLTCDSDMLPPRASYPIRIGFLGFPCYHKGWDVFEALASRHFDDHRYAFYHLGMVPGTPSRNIRFVRVAVGADDRDAMVREVRINDLDIVVNWSRCFETFSWSTYEAVAGGAFVVARRDAGNVWPILSHPSIDRGIAVEDADGLFALFASGEVLKFDLRRRYGTLAVRAPLTEVLLDARDG